MIARFKVHGLVQGVGFRWFVRQHALRLGLDGTVENLPTGAVAILASGDEVQIRKLVDLIGKGPPTSNVTKVDSIEISDDEYLVKGFSIVR